MTDPEDDPDVRTRTDRTSFERRRRGEGRASVAVIGGGVAGLTVAHELGDRDFQVRVFEENERFGGKARSMPGPERGDGPPLPAEHGFRFFPGFYRHLTDTLERIPYGDRTVADNLVSATELLQGRIGEDPETVAIETPRSVEDWREVLESAFGGQRVPPDEATYFVNRLLYLLTACEKRREEELEEVSWWEFIDAESMSEAYQKYLGYGLTQTMVAMRPERSSARTVGQIYLQLLLGRFLPSMDADRVLNGPTSDVWIDPWVGHLDDLGVDLRPGTRVERIYADGNRVTGVELAGGTEVTADYYVAALPLEVLRELRTRELAETAPSLRDLDRLETAWMCGLQFYLRERLDLVDGHGIYYDSPWALTSVSQAQFFDEYDLSARGDGQVEDVLSVIVSEWDEPGLLYEKPARECRPEEIRDEVWAQLKAHLNRRDRVLLDDEDVLDWHLDPELEFDDGVTNAAPLLINTTGSLRYRPPVRTESENFLLAGDYVRTNTDLASMEAASEAGRRAVAAILDSEGIRANQCEVWSLQEPSVFEPLKRQDQLNYELGLPHPAEATDPIWQAYKKVRDEGDLSALFD